MCTGKFMSALNSVEITGKISDSAEHCRDHRLILCTWPAPAETSETDVSRGHTYSCTRIRAKYISAHVPLYVSDFTSRYAASQHLIPLQHTTHFTHTTYIFTSAQPEHSFPFALSSEHVHTTPTVGANEDSEFLGAVCGMQALRVLRLRSSPETFQRVDLTLTPLDLQATLYIENGAVLGALLHHSPVIINDTTSTWM